MSYRVSVLMVHSMYQFNGSSTQTHQDNTLNFFSKTNSKVLWHNLFVISFLNFRHFCPQCFKTIYSSSLHVLSSWWKSIAENELSTFSISMILISVRYILFGVLCRYCFNRFALVLEECFSPTSVRFSLLVLGWHVCTFCETLFLFP